MSADDGSPTETRCRICGSSPASHADPFGSLLCAPCNDKYVVTNCDACGSSIMHPVSDPRTRCSFCKASDEWESLPFEVRERIDDLVRDDNNSGARWVIYSNDTLGREIGINQTQTMVAWRSHVLRDEIVYREPFVADAPWVISKTDALDQPPVAIEAEWDGDTQGWFLRLNAILERAGRRNDQYDDVTITTYSHRSGDMRLFNGQVPPWPEAQQAREVGEEVARHYNIPFYIAGDTPNDYPRWWDVETR